MVDIRTSRVADRIAAVDDFVEAGYEVHLNLSQVNLGWHPRAEELLRRPDLQQPKCSQNGSWNVRCRNDVKRAGVARVQELVAAHAPWLQIRDAF